MNKQHLKYTLAIIILGTLLFSAQPVAGSPVNRMTPAQIVDPFEEMMTGVYAATQWWNESSDDWGDTNFTGSYDHYYPVEDTSGNVYWIREQDTYDIYDEWNFSNLLVVIILDPDASVMAWLAENPDGAPTYPDENSTFSEPVYYEVVDPNTGTSYFDLWTLFWSPPVEAMTGDEVFVYSSFYFSYYYTDYYYQTNFTWYDDDMVEVDPNDIIPVLADDYEWASWMNESWTYDDEWSYYGFGYDISEMTKAGDQLQWMNHYYSGMSAYNDSNRNGIMDMVYKEVEYDFDNDGVVDWTTYVIDAENSEKVFDFYSDSATLGEINLPALNDAGQIEWSAEVVNVKGDFWEYTPWEALWMDDSLNVSEGYVEPEYIPVEVEYLEMVYRFEVTEDAAVVKIDQLIGDFTDPVTGQPVPELEGLGLTMNYWSSFSSYTITPETSEGSLDYGGVYEAEPAPDGNLEFVQENTSELISVSFGGTYVWEYDGATYDVGTIILPDYYSYGYAYMEGSYDSASISAQDTSWAYSTFYYSSCYSNWDGYAIVHDPIYAVYPTIAPGQVSGVMSGLVTASLAIGIVGIAAIAIVFTRSYSIRKLK